VTAEPVEDRALDDAALVELARGGDLDAYEVLVQRHRRAAHRTAWLVAGGAAEADDAVQEAFVRAWRAIDRFRPGAPFRPWLLRIVANEARNRRRAAGRREALALRWAGQRPTGDVPTPEEATLAEEDRVVLLEALERLDERDRLVLSCRFLLGLSEAETAAVLDRPAGTVKSRTSRALVRLRGLMATEVASE
jgi:RNA polymerase sigma factor (sigma-70 family)